MTTESLAALMLECGRCHHTWLRRIGSEPRQCPKCKSKYWNRERVRPVSGPELEVTLRSAPASPQSKEAERDLFGTLLRIARKIKHERDADGKRNGEPAAPAAGDAEVLADRKAGTTVDQDRAQRVLRKTGSRKVDPAAKGKAGKRTER